MWLLPKLVLLLLVVWKGAPVEAFCFSLMGLLLDCVPFPPHPPPTHSRCELQCSGGRGGGASGEQLGRLYGVLSRRRARVLAEVRDCCFLGFFGEVVIH